MSERSIIESSVRGSNPTLALRVCSEEHFGTTIQMVSPNLTIGASDSCFLRIRAEGVEPLHCLIVRERDAINFRNGSAVTLVNGQPASGANLQLGDRLTIGPVTFELIDDTLQAGSSELFNELVFTSAQTPALNSAVPAPSKPKRNKDGRVSSSKSRKTRLKQKARNLEAALWKNRYRIAKGKFEKAQRRERKSRDRLATLTQSLESLRGEMTAAAEEASHISVARAAELESLVSGLQDANTAIQAERDEIARACETLFAELNEYRDHFEKANSAVAHYSQEAQSLRLQLATTQATVVEQPVAEHVHKECERQIQTLQANVVELQSLLTSKEDEFSDLRSKRESLEREQFALKESHDRFEVERLDLANQLDAMRWEVKADKEELHRRVHEYEAQLAESKLHSQHWEQTARGATHRASDLDHQRKSLEARLVQLEDELTAARNSPPPVDSTGALTNQIVELESQRSNLQDALDRTTAELQCARAEIDSAKVERASFEREVVLERECDRSRLNDQERRLEQALFEKGMAQTEAERLRTEIAKLERDLQDLNRKHSEASEISEAHRHSLSRLIDLEEQFRRKSQDHDYSRMEVEQLREETNRLREEVECARHTASDQASALEGAFQQAACDRDNALAEVERLREQVSRMDHESQATRRADMAALAEMEKLQQDLRNEIDQLKTERSLGEQAAVVSANEAYLKNHGVSAPVSGPIQTPHLAIDPPKEVAVGALIQQDAHNTPETIASPHEIQEPPEEPIGALRLSDSMSFPVYREPSLGQRPPAPLEDQQSVEEHSFTIPWRPFSLNARDNTLDARDNQAAKEDAMVGIGGAFEAETSEPFETPLSGDPSLEPTETTSIRSSFPNAIPGNITSSPTTSEPSKPRAIPTLPLSSLGADPALPKQTAPLERILETLLDESESGVSSDEDSKESSETKYRSTMRLSEIPRVPKEPETKFSSRATIPGVSVGHEVDRRRGSRHDGTSEESVQDYMERLLRRLRGEAISEGYVAALNKAPSETGSVNPVNTDGQSHFDLVTASEYLPRTVAPERGSDLAAMRAVALQTGFQAVEESRRQNQLLSAANKQNLAIVILLASAVVMGWGIIEFRLNLVAAGLASGIASFFWWKTGRELKSTVETQWKRPSAGEFQGDAKILNGSPVDPT